uniref:Uncharacterized protein n=1 Tax=Anguilla anguilla TaxID=7936 RepID=A0A0E9QJE4_ANGAN
MIKSIVSGAVFSWFEDRPHISSEQFHGHSQDHLCDRCHQNRTRSVLF